MSYKTTFPKSMLWVSQRSEAEEEAWWASRATDLGLVLAGFDALSAGPLAGLLAERGQTLKQWDVGLADFSTDELWDEFEARGADAERLTIPA